VGGPRQQASPPRHPRPYFSPPVPLPPSPAPPPPTTGAIRHTTGVNPLHRRRPALLLPARAPPAVGARPPCCRRSPPLLPAPAPPPAGRDKGRAVAGPAAARQRILRWPMVKRPAEAVREQHRGGGEAVAGGELSSCARGAAVATDRAPVPTALRPARAFQKRPGPARRRACSAEWAVQRSEQKSAIARVLLKMGCTHCPPQVNSRR